MDAKLAIKIHKVMSETVALEKDTVVGKGTKGEYKAVGEATVLNMIKPLLVKHGLIIVPVDGEIKEHVDEVIQYGKQASRTITQLKTYYDVVDVETGESCRIVGFGNGADTQDKGSGKAYTYAYKTAISKTFMLFSGEDTDNHHSDELSQQEPKITTQQLIDMAKSKGFDESKLIEKYNKEYSKNITEVKFIKAEVKKSYYDQLEKIK